MNWVHEFDLNAFRAINVGLHRSWLDPIFLVITSLGLGGLEAALSLLFALHKSTRHYVVPMVLTIAISGWLVADGIKALLIRERPSKLPFALPQERVWESSFPSGHTTTAFAAATMLLFLTWHTPHRRLGWLALVVAALVGFSRIYRGVHWPTDVLGGACCGIATSCLLYLILSRRRPAWFRESSP